MINFEDFCVELFQILRAYEREMVLYDSTGNRVYEPSEARRFYLTGDNILISISEQGDDSSLKLYLSPSLNLAQVMGFIETLRVMATKANLLFHVKKFNKEIKPQDFATKAAVNENQEQTMNIMEGMYGTSKSSYLKLENARMIVRHGARINENMIGSRGRNIQAIFVENAQGERFLFPVNVLAGARAMTQHVNHGGSFEDQVGAQIIRMAHDFRNLAKVAHPGARSLVVDANAFGSIRESAISAMKQSKLAFARIASDRSYVRESEKLTSSNSLMETSEDLSEKISQLAAILGESFNEVELNTYARLFNLNETIAQFDEVTDDVKENLEEFQGDNGYDASGMEVDELFDFEPGNMVQIKGETAGMHFRVIDVNGDIVTVRDEEGNTGKMSAGELEPVSQEHVDLPITNNEAIQQFNSWMEDFNPDTFLRKEKVEEMPSISDMNSGWMKDRNAQSGVNSVRGGHQTVTTRNGEYKSMGPTKSSQMVAGTVVMASYSSHNQGADVVEVLGYRTDHFADSVEYPSLQAMAKKFGAKSLNALDEAVREAKGGKYGNGVYMCVKDLEDGSSGAWYYVSGGRFCRGSGAERLSFTKLEKMTSESLGEADEVSMHDIKSMIQQYKGELASTSPFDAKYGKLRSQIRDLEVQLKKNAPYGKAVSAVDEATAKPTSYTLTVPEECVKLIAFLNECEFEEIDQWVYDVANDISEDIGNWVVTGENTVSLSIGGGRYSPRIQNELQNSFAQWCHQYEPHLDEAERQPGEAKVKAYKISTGGDSVDDKKLWAFANSQDVLTIENISCVNGTISIYPFWDESPSEDAQSKLQASWNQFSDNYDESEFDEDGSPL